MEEERSIERESLSLKEANESDIADYIEIEKKIEGRTYLGLTTIEDVRNEFTRCKTYMIKVGEESVGSVSYEIKEDGSVYLSGLAVQPESQGRGYARYALEKVLSEIGEKKVWLVTHPDNNAAIKLYQSCGFEIGERKENYFGNGEPRIVLRRNL